MQYWSSSYNVWDVYVRLGCLRKTVLYFIFSVVVVVWLVDCFVGDEVVHIYIFACVSAFSEGVVQFYKHRQNQLMPWHEQIHKSWSRNICNKFIMYFYIYFVRENNIKWPFQIRTSCLITENNLISVTILHVSVIMSQCRCPDILESLMFSVLTWAFEISIACLLCLLYTMSVTINSVVQY